MSEYPEGIEVIDDYLPSHIFAALQQFICWNKEFPFYLRDRVNPEPMEDEVNNWYGIHMLYRNDVPTSHAFNQIYPQFIQYLKDDDRLNVLIRAKANFYGNTAEIVEHQVHTDYKFSHTAAILSLNTCDGFTRIGDTKVESIQNRIVFFDGSTPHNSSSCTNAKGRYNIALNYFAK